VTPDGTKIPVGLRLGDTENKTVVTALLADIVGRGPSYPHGLLVVIDGAKALAAGVKAVFGDQAIIQRCQLRKRRNVTGHLSKTDRETIDARLAAELDRTHPDATASLREGLNDMFTVRRLGIDGTRTHVGPRPARNCFSASASHRRQCHTHLQY